MGRHNRADTGEMSTKINPKAYCEATEKSLEIVPSATNIEGRTWVNASCIYPIHPARFWHLFIFTMFFTFFFIPRNRKIYPRPSVASLVHKCDSMTNAVQVFFTEDGWIVFYMCFTWSFPVTDRGKWLITLLWTHEAIFAAELSVF